MPLTIDEKIDNFIKRICVTSLGLEYEKKDFKSQLAELLCEEEKINFIMKDHYWDSLEKDRGIIEKHCEFIAHSICEYIKNKLT